MSGLAHADFEHYVNLSATWDGECGLVHNIGPRRDPLWDNTVLWLAARQFIIVLACVLKVHAHLDDSDFLAAATQVVEAEDRLHDELEAAMRDRA